MIDTAYHQAIQVLKKNSTPYGFKASFKHYPQIWGRDGCITILGVLPTGDKELIKASKLTLETLGKLQTSLVKYQTLLTQKPGRLVGMP